MHFLQSTVFVLLATALGLVTATAEQGDANRPFGCTSVHPVAYCSREIGNQQEEVILATPVRNHFSCESKGMKNAWCCFSRQLKIEVVGGHKRVSTANRHDVCVPGRVPSKKN
ncbi:hypothetical protein PGT21_008381 [Puccinia graminis f. sp. tritici]|uniref:Uncharacterized protein n=1 Tax=Puccinia graminis f. sp. tritici TaxID=56615 RepID=A0A5B0RHN3_PUCGR|nr:hypothetical protein PGT21_008381 [Puccinia graminis f. sp. tritici]KAA1125230.1 hypothetical protein PGTUg99_009795 [Puccinia graminis f. sp. tritici]